MKKKNLVIALTLICLMLSGCDGIGKSEDPGGKNPASGVNLTNNLSGLRNSENVKFLYEKPSLGISSPGIYSCERANAAMDKFNALFSKTPECEKRSYPETKRRISSYKTETEEGIISYTNDIMDGVRYYTGQGSNFNIIEGCSGVIDEITEFDFISRAKLSEKIKKTVHDLLRIDVEVTIDAVTKDRFSADVSKHIDSLKELYGSAPDPDKYGGPADFYAVRITQKIDGITYDGGYGEAIYTANGLELLSVFYPVRIGLKTNTSGEFIDIDGAENLLKQKYGLLLLSEPEQIEKAELIYAHSDGVMIPVWKFTAKGGAETVFDAYTGKEIVFGAPGEKG